MDWNRKVLVHLIRSLISLTLGDIDMSSSDKQITRNSVNRSQVIYLKLR